MPRYGGLFRKFSGTVIKSMKTRLNKKHQKTLTAIFSQPVSSTLQWRRIEALFTALGARKEERSGSTVLFQLNGENGLFHRPHPRKEARQYQIRNARDFLGRAGITL